MPCKKWETGYRRIKQAKNTPRKINSGDPVQILKHQKKSTIISIGENK